MKFSNHHNLLTEAVNSQVAIRSHKIDPAKKAGSVLIATRLRDQPDLGLIEDFVLVLVGG